MAVCESGDVVIIERLDRLARDLMVSEAMVRDCQRRGIALVSTLEPDLCSDDPTRKLIRQVLSAFAEYDKSMLVAKLKHARERVKARTGRCGGRTAYGERRGERDTLARMHELRAQGLSYERIGTALNMAGVLTRDGKLWNVGTVFKAMRRTPFARVPGPALGSLYHTLRNGGDSHKEALQRLANAQIDPATEWTAESFRVVMAAA
jgi:hypothetical protein